jgi:hypothetical protein
VRVTNEGMKHMKRIIYVSIFFLLLTLNAAAEERQLQAAVPSEAGTIALRVTLDEGVPPLLGNDTGINPAPGLSPVPEPATLGLMGLDVVGLLAVGLRRKKRKNQ